MFFFFHLSEVSFVLLNVTKCMSSNQVYDHTNLEKAGKMKYINLCIFNNVLKCLVIDNVATAF